MKTINFFISIFASFLLIVIIAPPQGFSQQTSPIVNITAEYIPGTIVIKIKEGLGSYQKQEGTIQFGISSLDKIATKYNISKLEKRFKHKPIANNSGLPDLSRIYRIAFAEDINVLQVANAFAKDSNIEYAEPISKGKFTEIPDDPSYPSQQHLPQIMAEEAWDVHKGEDGEEVVVAIVDTGADWLHPDLTENCWQNLGEDADGDGVTLEFNDGVWERDPDDINGIDDDGNGYVDDVIGWDFHEDLTIGDGSNPDPIWGQGPYEHGSHCAGIAAGRTNNGVGISSVSWNIKYMPVQTDDGNNTVLYGIDGVIYAAENGADVISCSWYYGYAYSQADDEAMQYASGLGSILCFAAANDNSSNIAVPAGYAGVLSVAAVNPNDTRASFSNYGVAVDIAAPGVSILSTTTDNGYASWNGTSMATPMVAGLIGYLKSYNPEMTNEQLIAQVVGTTDDIDELNPGFENALGSGRINAYHTLVDENVEVPQELRLAVASFIVDDEDGDGVIEAGETVTVSLSFRNFAHFVSDENASVVLSSFDNDITITTASADANIPGDDYFELSNALEFKVSENATTHVANLLVEVVSDLPVVVGGEIEIPLLIAPSGFFVWEGNPNEPDYSGTYINTLLEARGFNTLYSNYYPPSFGGFDAVFLSFGNAGQNIQQATFFDYPYSIPIQDYLEKGGTLYSEGSPFLTIPDLSGYPNADVFKQLYGVEDASLQFSANGIDELNGLDATLGENMTFYNSNQQYNWYIDRYIGMENALLPFNENNYGDVAIYNEGAEGQKTFHFAYSLSQLVDEDPHSSRYNLMMEILNFFGYADEESEIFANFSADKIEGEPDLEVQFTDWSITDNDVEITGYAWDFDGDGVYDSDQKDPMWTYTEGGVYDVELIVFSANDSDTLLKKDFITVRSGILVYEGKNGENGYSGTYIYDHLINYSYNEVGYTNTFPTSLEGYDAVFLSFGNTGSMGSLLTNQMMSAIFNFSVAGGKIFIEGGDALSSFSLNDIWVFGLSGVGNGSKNVLTELNGQDDALTEGLHFEASTQLSVRSIDTYEVMEEVPGVAEAFYESTYGPVAVQFDGSDVSGQKTFCMSYTLADLEDGEGLSTKKELLARILNFFDVVSDVDELSPYTNTDLKVYPNPTTNQLTITGLPIGSEIQLTDLTGNILMTQNTIYRSAIINLSEFPKGIYFIRTKSGVKKIVKM